MADFSLSGKIVVVTGAAGRLGRLVVEQFARDGATIVALVRSEDEARSIPFPEEAEGWAFAVDAADEGQVTACFEQIQRQFGRVDVLIHAVGGWEKGPLLETSLEAWEGVMRRNLGSAFLCFREAARLMQEHGGRLIGIGAGQGVDRAVAQEGAYAAAKAGLMRLVEATAAEFEGTGITAHLVAPSTIRYAGDDGPGVAAHALVDLCRYLASPAGDALNGSVIRAYGDA